MRRKIWRAAVAGILMAGGGAALAHHSFAAEFDTAKSVTLDGTVTKFEWVNPHSWIHVSVAKDPRTGKPAQWRIEGGAPSALLRRGWNRNSLPPGTKIVAQAFASRDGDNRASASEIAFPNGQTLSLGNPTTEAAVAAAARAKGN